MKKRKGLQITCIIIFVLCLSSVQAYAVPLAFTPNTKIGIQTDTPASTLEVAGSIGYKVRTVDMATAIAGDEAIILTNTATVGGNINIQLPSAASTTGRVYTIKRTNHDEYTVVVNSNDGIDHGSTLKLKNPRNSYAYVSLVSNGERWLVTAANGATISNPTLGIPTDGLILHLDAETLFLNEDDPVVKWPDPSSIENTVSQSDTTFQPTYIAHGINGKPVVRFKGNQVLTKDGELVGNGKDRTIFIVARPANNENSAILSDGTRSAEGSEFAISPEVGVYASKGGCLFKTRASISHASVITVVLEENKKDGLAAWINSSPLEEIRTNSYERIGSGKFTIGASSSETGGYDKFFKGDIAEVLIYDRVLSSTERNAVEDYLKEWWLH